MAVKLISVTAVNLPLHIVWSKWRLKNQLRYQLKSTKHYLIIIIIKIPVIPISHTPNPTSWKFLDVSYLRYNVPITARVLMFSHRSSGWAINWCDASRTSGTTLSSSATSRSVTAWPICPACPARRWFCAVSPIWSRVSHESSSYSGVRTPRTQSSSPTGPHQEHWPATS